MASSDRKGPPVKGELAKSMHAAQPYIDAAWQLIGAIALCAFAGWWLDRKFGLKPWLLLAGAMFGLFAGMYSFIHRVMYLADKEKSARGPDGGDKPSDVEDR